MKFGLLSDCHLCVDRPPGRLDNNMLEIGLNKLNYVFEKAYGLGVRDILQAGDLVDIKRSWELLTALSKFFKVWKDKGMSFYCILGQHDSYYHDMSNEKTIIGILISTGLAKRLTSTPIYSRDSIFAIYGSSYGENIPTPESEKRNILVCHRQILMKKIWKDQSDYDYAPDFLLRHNYDLILCGDVHQRFDFKNDKRIICNTGPLMRLEVTSAMMSHMPGFFIYDSEKKNELAWHEIKAKKGEEVLSKNHLNMQKLRKQNFDDFIAAVQQEGDENRSLDFNQNLQAIMEKHKAGKGVRYKISEYLAKGN